MCGIGESDIELGGCLGCVGRSSSPLCRHCVAIAYSLWLGRVFWVASGSGHESIIFRAWPRA